MKRVGQIIVVLLVLQAVVGVYVEALNFHVPFWIKHLEFPDVFDLSYTCLKLLGYLSFVITFIGLIKVMMFKKFELIPIFKFPIFLTFASSLFWFITSFLSTKYSFVLLPAESPWYYYIYRYLNLFLVILIVIEFGTKNKASSAQDEHSTKVGKASRFFNWLIDSFIIFVLGFHNLRILADGFIFEDVPFFRNNAHWFFILNVVVYYFMLELVFLQTIGKLHSNSYVSCQDSRLKSVAIRTLSRLIPFESFSFFGKVGWHDALSKTAVVRKIKR